MKQRIVKFGGIVYLIVALALTCTAQDLATFRDPSPHRTQFLAVGDGVQLEVLDWGGSGRPVVFLAGYNTAHEYDEIAPKLTDIAHVYGITRRGLGASSKPGSGYTAKESGADVVQVLDTLRLEKPLLVGHSFGGQDLTVLGAEYPDRMAGLVYLDSADDTTLGPLGPVRNRAGLLDPSNFPEAFRNAHADRPDIISSFGSWREWQRRNLGMAFPEAELRQLYASNADGTPGAYLVSKEVRDAMFAGVQAPEYAHIRVPVLAVFSLPPALEDQLKLYKPQNAEQGAAMGLQYGLDLAWAARNEDALKRGVPGARVVEVTGARTFIFLSNEADVLRELRAFLVELGR